MNLVGGCLAVIVRPQLSLKLLGALHGVDDRGKVYQESIAHELDDLSVMLRHCLPDDVVMDFEQAQRTGFVSPHLMTKADHVGEHDRREPSRLWLLHLPGGLLSRQEYTATGLAVYRAWQWARTSPASHTSEKRMFSRRLA